MVELVLGVADDLQLGESERRDAEFVALLHDVGKIRVPSEIINKPGPLTATERVGGLLGHVGHLVRSCHEHWDGNGYPDLLAASRRDKPLSMSATN